MTFKKTLTKKQLLVLEEMVGIGLSLKSCATIIGTSEATLMRMIKKLDAVRESVDRGLAENERDVVTAAHKMAKSGEHPYMTRFFLMAKHKWRVNEDLTIHAGGRKDTDEIPSQDRREGIEAMYSTLKKIESRKERDVTPEIDEEDS